MMVPKNGDHDFFDKKDKDQFSVAGLGVESAIR